MGAAAEGNPQVVFQNLDTNGDGSLSRHELAVGFGQLGIELSEPELTETIRMLDENGDGRVELEEFVRMGRTATQLAKEREERLTLEREQKELLDQERGKRENATAQLSASAAEQFQEQRRRLDQIVTAQEEMLDTQEHLLASHATEQRKLGTLPAWLRLMSRPEAATILQEMDRNGSGLIGREDFVRLLSDGLGEDSPVEEATIEGMIEMLGGLVKGEDDDEPPEPPPHLPELEGDESRDLVPKNVRISALVEICALSSTVQAMDTQFREELEQLVEKEQQSRDELDQMLHGKFGSQEEKEREAQKQNEAARAAVAAALAVQIAEEREAREADAIQMREEAERRQREREEAERVLAEEETARLIAEEDAARLAAEESAAQQQEREAQEEAAWQKKHGVVQCGWVSVELEKKNVFTKMWCVLTPGLLTMCEKRLMPAQVTYPLAGSSVTPIAPGKRKAVSGAFEVLIDEEAQKRVRGLQLAEETKRKFVMGFDQTETEERQQAWQQTIIQQASTFAKDEDIAAREKRYEMQALHQLVGRLGLEGSIVKYGWLYVEGVKKAFADSTQLSRLCVISTALLTVYEACPEAEGEMLCLSQIPLARCVVTAEPDKRKGMEGGSFRVKFGSEALAYATGERMPEVVLSCREPPTRKKGQSIFPAEVWQEKMTAQAFLPPSWLGHADLHGFDNVAESLVTYEVDLRTGNGSGAGTKAKVFIVRCQLACTCFLCFLCFLSHLRCVLSVVFACACTTCLVSIHRS
jgi:Ca2+-binding EF-hand superfamily protein